MGLVILGMHRSGTSAVAALCHAMGAQVAPPDDLMDATEWNERGHWESESLTRFNEDLLVELGGSWDDPPVGTDWIDTDRGLELVAEAHGIFHDLHPGEPWVWKDPRACVLLPFWRRVLASDDIAAVVCWREPGEVIDSLQRRDGIGFEAAGRLWSRYVGDSLVGVTGLPVAVVSYHDLLASPAAVAAHIAVAGTAVGLTLDPSGADDVIEADLRHSRNAHVDLPADVEALRSHLVEIDGFHTRFDAAPDQPTWRAAEAQLTAARDRARRQHHELGELRRGIGELRTVASGFEIELAARSAALDDATTELANRTGVIEELGTEVTTRAEIIDELTGELERRSEVIDGLSTELAKRAEIIDGLGTELAKRSAVIDELSSECALRLEILTAAEARLRAEQELRRTADSDRTEAEAELAQLGALIAERNATIDALQAQLAASRNAVAVIRGSIPDPAKRLVRRLRSRRQP